jgi:feruloyl esterase
MSYRRCLPSIPDPTPAQWNNVIRTWGSGGWAGGYQADITRLGSGSNDNAPNAFAVGSTATYAGNLNTLWLAAVNKGYVVSTSDHGHGEYTYQGVRYHGGNNYGGGNGSFAWTSGGAINTALWKDFSENSMRELATRIKALVKLYYGKPQQYAYWDGFSTGGRQAHKLAQKYPGDYDGILAGAPAFNWTKFITGELYPQVVMQRELGGPIAQGKLNYVSGLATAAGDLSHLGFLLDPLASRYDPAADPSALCAGQGIGTSTNPTCVTLAEANAVNKIWYGITSDGSAPSPAADNGNALSPNQANRQLWYGPTRGTTLAGGTISPLAPFAISSMQVALQLQNPAIEHRTGNDRRSCSRFGRDRVIVDRQPSPILR